MHNGKVEICGVNTSQLEVMREPEKMRLIALSQKGDAAARDALVAGNLRLVLSIIQRFLNRGEPPDDLFQVGCIGLLKAIDNFDLTHGVRFSTYAVPMIIGEVRRYLRDNNAVRVSRSLRDTAYRAMQTKETLQNRNGREPSVAEIAATMAVEPSEVVAALESVVDPVSLYDPLYADSGDPAYVMDLISTGEGEEDWLFELTLRQTVASLPAREKRILTLRFLAGHTQIEVAAAVGISQAQVSRLEKNALEKIRGGM